MTGLQSGFVSSDAKTSVVARKLGSLSALSQNEREMLSRLGALTRHPTRTRLTPTLEAGVRTRYLVSGWAVEVRELADGRRQLSNVVLPGDCIGASPHLPVKLPVQSITQVELVDGSAVSAASRDSKQFPGIAAAVQLAAAEERAFLVDQIVRLGRQTAYERIAHLFLELQYRCSAVGLTQHDASFLLPLTQEIVGDLLGLSIVHVNRTLQVMRNEKMIELRHGKLTLLNRPALVRISEFREPQVG